MRKKHHIFFIANISLLLIAIILGLVFQGSISDCGISHLSNIKDVEDSHIVLNYACCHDREGRGRGLHRHRDARLRLRRRHQGGAGYVSQCQVRGAGRQRV